MQYKKHFDVLQVAGLMLQVRLLTMLEWVSWVCLNAELWKRPYNNFINDNSEYSQNLELLGLCRDLVHPILGCWDIAHPVTVQCSCWSLTCLWRASTVHLWRQTMDVRNFLSLYWFIWGSIWVFRCRCSKGGALHLQSELFCNWHLCMCQVCWNNSSGNS